eukprot:gene13566-biopygen3971
MVIGNATSVAAVASSHPPQGGARAGGRVGVPELVRGAVLRASTCIVLGCETEHATVWPQPVQYTAAGDVAFALDPDTVVVDCGAPRRRAKRLQRCGNVGEVLETIGRPQKPIDWNRLALQGSGNRRNPGETLGGLGRPRNGLGERSARAQGAARPMPRKEKRKANAKAGWATGTPWDDLGEPLGRRWESLETHGELWKTWGSNWNTLGKPWDTLDTHMKALGEPWDRPAADLCVAGCSGASPRRSAAARRRTRRRRAAARRRGDVPETVVEQVRAIRPIRSEAFDRDEQLGMSDHLVDQCNQMLYLCYAAHRSRRHARRRRRGPAVRTGVGSLVAPGGRRDTALVVSTDADESYTLLVGGCGQADVVLRANTTTGALRGLDRSVSIQELKHSCLETVRQLVQFDGAGHAYQWGGIGCVGIGPAGPPLAYVRGVVTVADAPREM